MEYIKVTSENIENEHICCAISNNNDIQVSSKKAWLKELNGVALGSDAFFPFGDNIERAHKSGVEFIAQTGGSVRDDNVIETCDKYNIAMAFTGIRLFHH